MDLVINIMNQLFFYILEKNQVSVCLMNLLACAVILESIFFLTVHIIKGSTPCLSLCVCPVSPTLLSPPSHRAPLGSPVEAGTAGYL